MLDILDMPDFFTSYYLALNRDDVSVVQWQLLYYVCFKETNTTVLEKHLKLVVEEKTTSYFSG